MVWLHRWLILLCVLIGTVAAVAYLATASRVYSAEADLFVSPVSSTSTTTLPLGLITSSGNPTGDVETAVRLVTTIDAARAVKSALGLPQSPQQILRRINAQPVAQSNIVALSAQAGQPRAAATLANAFANAVIRLRTAQFHSLIASEIANLDAQLRAGPIRTADSGVLKTQIAQLRTLLAAPLPDMRVSSYATPPTSPTSPRTATVLGAGVLGSLAAGLALSLLLELVDVRVWREQQLQSLFRLPVLALIPREGRGRGAIGRFTTRLPFIRILAERRRIRRSVPRTPDVLSPAALETYRTLRAALVASRPDQPSSRSILVTSASAGEGKTTTAINLAFSLATSGRNVILIEADLHRPSIGKAIGQAPDHTIAEVLTDAASFEDALVEHPQFPNLRYLLARRDPEPSALVADSLLRPAAALLLSQAVHEAEFVIVDAPPLAEVIDALELARLVDDVLLVVRLGQTRLLRLAGLGELLARSNITPRGIALVGVERSQLFDSYGYGYGSYLPSAVSSAAQRGS